MGKRRSPAPAAVNQQHQRATAEEKCRNDDFFFFFYFIFISFYFILMKSYFIDEEFVGLLTPCLGGLGSIFTKHGWVLEQIPSSRDFPLCSARMTLCVLPSAGHRRARARARVKAVKGLPHSVDNDRLIDMK